MTSFFDKGKAHYERQEYEDAVRCFVHGSAEQLCDLSRMWLGQCFEYGLGTTKDLSIAKDLYHISFSQLGIHNKGSKQGLWLQERIECLSNIPESDECIRFVAEIGNVKIKKHINAPHTPTIRFNKNEPLSPSTSVPPSPMASFMPRKHSPLGLATGRTASMTVIVSRQIISI